MKTPQEWMLSLNHCPNDKNVVTKRLTLEIISFIQSDAATDAKARGIVTGLRMAAKSDLFVANAFMNPIRMIRIESANNHTSEADRLERELAAKEKV